jgi:hypothetical protein
MKINNIINIISKSWQKNVLSVVVRDFAEPIRTEEVDIPEPGVDKFV